MFLRLISSVVFLLIVPHALLAQQIGFGDNASEWATNGECDDMRFEGVGMTGLELLFADLLHDAADFRRGIESKGLTFVGIQ